MTSKEISPPSQCYEDAIMFNIPGSSYLQKVFRRITDNMASTKAGRKTGTNRMSDRMAQKNANDKEDDKSEDVVEMHTECNMHGGREKIAPYTARSRNASRSLTRCGSVAA